MLDACVIFVLTHFIAIVSCVALSLIGLYGLKWWMVNYDPKRSRNNRFSAYVHYLSGSMRREAHKASVDLIKRAQKNSKSE
jgi:hypothetical protein